MKKIYISILLISCITLAAQAQWNTATPMNAIRAEHASASLPDGQVLVAGGWDYTNNLKTGEIYDPALDIWTPTPALNSAHSAGAAVTLNNGKVLLIGGYTGTVNTTACELYDPVADTWTATGSLTTGRSYFTATLLNNGKVLVAGGYNPSVGYQVSTAELYDPVAGTWSPGGSLVVARSYHSAVLLNSGKVLVAGGLGTILSVLNQLMAVEIYDPATNTWSGGADMLNRRDFFGMSKLANGNVMVSGGRKFIGSSNYLGITSVEIYNPTNNTWSASTPLPSQLCYNQQITLADGRVLCMAGLDSINITSGNSIKGTTYVYDFTGSMWTAASPAVDGRYEFASVLMADSRVMVSGGIDNSVELYGTAVGVPQIGNKESLTLYPNPARNQFSVYGLPLSEVPLTLEMFNVLGESVYSTKLQTANSKQQTVINVSSLRPGVYFVKIQSSGQTMIQKLTVAN